MAHPSVDPSRPVYRRAAGLHDLAVVFGNCRADYTWSPGASGHDTGIKDSFRQSG